MQTRSEPCTAYVCRQKVCVSGTESVVGAASRDKIHMIIELSDGY